MKVRKTPMRTCVVSREVLPKRELIRIAATKEGIVSIDLSGKAPGRGAYLKKDSKTVELAIKNKALEKKLEVKIPDKIYQELLRIINA